MALSTRLQDMDSTSTNIRVMEQARPGSRPFSPNTKLNLILGLGLRAGARRRNGAVPGIPGQHDQLAAELQSLTGLPTLAVIPRYREGGATAPRMRRRQAPSPAATDRSRHAVEEAGGRCFRSLPGVAHRRSCCPTRGARRDGS